MWRTFRDKYAPETGATVTSKDQQQQGTTPTTTPLCLRRLPNQGLSACAPLKLSTTLRESHTSVGELRPGQGTAGTHRYLESWPRSRLDKSLVPGSVGWAGKTPMQIPAHAHPLRSPRYPPDPWWKLLRSTPTLVQTGKYDTYLPKGVSASMTTYQTWNAPTFLRGNFQGRRQVTGEEST